MNRHCFRLVFNRRRGLLMAVAETAVAAAALGSTAAPAQIVADPGAPGGQRPTVLGAGNGVPQVNIQTPSSAGVSRNTYRRFDVDSAGVILNNSRTEVRTQLGGWAQGNPWLANGPARVILNEVRSSDPSQLGGFVEVAGGRAQVVIANPAGIRCDGCGFINASHATLTTGTPVFNGASFDGLRVQGGAVTIHGRGLDASATDFTDLIARSVQLNAGVWARTLRVTAGAADVGIDGNGSPAVRGAVQPSAGPTPAFAIDTAQLGGMYANHITLVATEAGVGVRNAGHLGASVGEVRITAAGQLVNSGRIVAGSDVRVAAASVSSSGAMAAGIDSEGYVTQAARLAIDASGDIRSSGSLVSGDGVDLRAGGSVDLSGGLTASGGALQVDAVVLANRNGHIVSGGMADLRVTALDNTDGNLHVNGDLRLSDSALAVDNVRGSISADRDIVLNLARLDNTAGRIATATGGGGDVDITLAGALANAGGRIGADRDVRLEMQRLDGEGEVAAGRDLRIALQDSFTLTAGQRLAANRDIDLSTAGNFTNEGRLVARRDLRVGAHHLRNAGELAAGALAALDSNTLDNTGRILGGSVIARASEWLHNEGAGAVIGASDAAGTLTLLSPQIVNRDAVTATDTAPQATLIGLGDVVLAGGVGTESGPAAAQSVLNESGLIFAGRDLTIVADTFTNTRRIVQASETYDVPQPAVSGQVAWTSQQPDVPGGRPIEPPHEGRLNSDYLYTDYTAEVTRNRLVAISPQAQVQAGRNFMPRLGTLRNYWSAIAAGGDIPLSGITLDNDGWRGATPLGEQTVYTGQYVYRTYRGEIWSQPLIDSGPRIVPLGGYDSSIVANGTLGGAGNTVINTAGSTTSTPLGAQGGRPVAGRAGGTLPLDGLTLPSGGLYRINTSPEARFLVETHPAFADRQQWQSSDLYFRALGLDIEQVGRRLGDGFYEQQLARNQLISLTGRSVLAGDDWDSQFATMLAEGAAFAREVQLAPGASLSSEQAARLTRDVILMETRIVQGQSVLVPVVHLAGAGRTQLLASGALIAAGDIALTDTRGFVNSGTVRAARSLAIEGDRIDSRGGQLHSGGAMSLGTQPGGDIDLTSARVSAGSLDIQSGGALVLDTGARQVTQVTAQGVRSATMLGQAASIDVEGDARIRTAGDLQQLGGHVTVGGDLQAQVGGSWRLGAVETRDTTDVQTGRGHSRSETIGQATSSVQVGGTTEVRAAQDIVAHGADLDLRGGGAISAGRDLVLGSAQARQQLDAASRNGRSASTTQRDDEAVISTQVTSGRSLALNAGQDLSLQAAQVSVIEGRATLSAGRDLSVDSVNESHALRATHAGSSRGLLSSRSSATSLDQRQTTAVASSVSGGEVVMQAGRDLRVQGSDVVGTKDVALSAGRNLSIEAAANTVDESFSQQTTRSGLFTSGFSVTAGTQQQGMAVDEHARTMAPSRVGSLEGSVTARAGGTYHQLGSEVLAPQGDIAIDAQRVDIVPGYDTAQGQQDAYMRQRGVTLALNSPVVAAVQTVQDMANAARRTDDSRVRGLAAASSALAVSRAAAAVRDGQNPVDADGNPIEPNAADKAGGISVSLSLGSSRSQSHTEAESSTAVRSVVAAGRDVRIVARGAGEDSDVNTGGALITAGRNLHLEAEDQLNLGAARSTVEQHGNESSSSASVGLSIGLGNSGAGLSVVASASRALGNHDGEATIYTNTEVKAGGRVTTRSGTDTRLVGAVISGQQVDTQVGTSGLGNLVIESLQDTRTYDERSRSAGFSVSVPIFGAGGSGSVSASRTRIDSDYASVGQQSGIRAGDGGFQVEVRGDTTLAGGAITSTQAAVDAGRIQFHTDGALALSDIANAARYDASSVSVQAGTNAGLNGRLTPTGTGVGVGHEQGEASSVTRAGISGIAGQVEARTGDAETGLRPIFDANRVRGEVGAQVAVTQVFGQEAPRIVAIISQGQAGALRSQADAESDPDRRSDLLAQAASWDEGGAFRVALQGLMGGLSGGLAGASGAAAAAAAAPLIDQLQGSVTSAPREAGASETVSQGVGRAVASLTAATMGGAAARGSTAGAAMGFNVDANNRQLHPPEVRRARDLAVRANEAGLRRPDGTAYTAQDMEEQMRLMGHAGYGEQPNSIAVMATTESVVNNIQQDPNMSRIVQGPVIIERSGRADSQLQAFIMSNTRMDSDFIPGQTPYIPSNTALDPPIYTTGPIDVPTATTANGDLAGRSGVGVQQNRPLTQQTREAIAESAGSLSRQAGVVSSIATATAAAGPPPVRAVATTVAAGTGAVAAAADVIHQLADPSIGKSLQDGVGSVITKEVRIKLPVALPIANEIVEAVKEMISTRTVPQMPTTPQGGDK